MKIVQYLSEIRLKNGGVDRAVLDLCGELGKVGHDVHLLTACADDVPEAWKRGEKGFPRCYELKRPTGPSVFQRFAKADLEVVARVMQGADVLHLHVPWDHTNTQFASIARRLNVPYVLSIHGMLDDWSIASGQSMLKKLYLFFIGRKLLERAAAVHCTAEAERTQAMKHFPKGRGVVLPLLMDLVPFQQPERPEEVRETLAKVPGSGPLVLFLGRLHPKKGANFLIEAAAELWKQNVEFRLAIAGPPSSAEYDAELRGLVSRLGVQDRVAFLGLVTGAAKIELMRSARMMVLPTHQENWGFAQTECLAAGRPVITTKGVDIWPELERSGGAIITTQQPAALAKEMRRLIEDQPLADSMGRKGWTWVMNDLNPRVVLKRYEDLYQSLKVSR